ncbi:MAG: glycosyltransferase [Rhodospirillales bacterium]|nr:glycosyltransferase [Rhodospirillales bacterium]
MVTPEVGLHADTVRASGSGVVVDGAPQKLAEAINHLLRDDAARAAMGEAGRRTAREEFSWSAIAERMERVYMDCLQSKQLSDHPSAGKTL